MDRKQQQSATRHVCNQVFFFSATNFSFFFILEIFLLRGESLATECWPAPAPVQSKRAKSKKMVSTPSWLRSTTTYIPYKKCLFPTSPSPLTSPNSTASSPTSPTLTGKFHGDLAIKSSISSSAPVS